MSNLSQLFIRRLHQFSLHMMEHKIVRNKKGKQVSLARVSWLVEDPTNLDAIGCSSAPSCALSSSSSHVDYVANNKEMKKHIKTLNGTHTASMTWMNSTNQPTPSPAGLCKMLLHQRRRGGSAGEREHSVAMENKESMPPQRKFAALLIDCVANACCQPCSAALCLHMESSSPLHASGVWQMMGSS